MRHLYLSSRSFKRLLSVSIGKRRRVEGSPEESGCNGQDESKSMVTSQDEKPPQRPNWRCFSYEEILKATNGFHQDNLVGRGGYAEVYRGLLEDGQVIAVKRLTRASSDEQKEKDFLQELGTIGHVRHPNVSALLGCCIDRDLHLIFEFSSHGSVSSNLHDEGSPPMAWKLRYNIAVGTARGLHYLHKGCQRRIIHRDIKASNILLTANFEPQISDFGLAKWLPSEWTHRAVAPIEGTFGCLAPEYFMHGIVDEKTDVFAFGVFLLEIISGRKPVDGSHKSLLSWAKPYLSDGTIQKLVDPRLEQDYDMGQLKRLTFIASLCIRATATWRPSMTEEPWIPWAVLAFFLILNTRDSRDAVVAIALLEKFGKLSQDRFRTCHAPIYKYKRQVLELLEDGEMLQQDRWKMPQEEEEEDEFWGFDDLDDEWDECDSPSSSSSTRSSQP